MNLYTIEVVKHGKTYVYSKTIDDGTSLLAPKDSPYGTEPIKLSKADALSKLDSLKKTYSNLKAKAFSIDRVNETSGTGTGASVTPGTGEGVATKYAFRKDEELTEGYNNFKKSITTRTPKSSTRVIERTIKRKIKEISNLLEYSLRLKEELGNEALDKEKIKELSSSLQELAKKLKNI